MHLLQRLLAVTLLLSVFALPSLVGAQAKSLRLLADKHGVHGTVILLNNCDASSMPKGAPPGKFQPDNADSIINGDDDRKQLEPIRIQRSQTAGPVSLKLARYEA